VGRPAARRPPDFAGRCEQVVHPGERRHPGQPLQLRPRQSGHSRGLERRGREAIDLTTGICYERLARNGGAGTGRSRPRRWGIVGRNRERSSMRRGSADADPALSLPRLKLESGATPKSGAWDRLGHADIGAARQCHESRNVPETEPASTGSTPQAPAPATLSSRATESSSWTRGAIARATGGSGTVRSRHLTGRGVG